MSDIPLLETERLLLRPLTLADAEGLHRVYGDPEAMRFWDFPASRNVAQTAKRIEQSLRVGKEWHAAWVVLRRGARDLIGMVNYHHREMWNHRLEVGYILMRRHWRQGLMNEAAHRFLRYCFEDLEAHRIEATIEPGNVASLRLAEKLGFQRESGLLRDRMRVNGEYRGVIMYGLLKEEWSGT